MRHRRGGIVASAMLAVLAGCTPTPSGPETTSPVEASAALVAASSSEAAEGFPIGLFAGLGDEPVSGELAAQLQDVLDESANGHGVTATLITPHGTWSGATGMATRERAMVPNDQMSIASITKTLVAAQVMQLVEAGELSLDDLAADRLPPDLEFDTKPSDDRAPAVDAEQDLRVLRR
jgi:CubicO group peptidase (beta-lactamase class C family)